MLPSMCVLWWREENQFDSLAAFNIIFARSVVHTLLRRSVQWRGRDVALRASADEVV